MTGDAPPQADFWSVKTSPLLVFRVLLAALMLSTGIGVWFATAQRARFEVAFPGTVSLPVYAGLLTVGVAGLVALIGMWRWRRWAVILYAVGAVAGIALDVLARAPRAHQATVVIAAVAVLTLVALNRQRFST